MERQAQELSRDCPWVDARVFAQTIDADSTRTMDMELKEAGGNAVWQGQSATCQTVIIGMHQGVHPSLPYQYELHPPVLPAVLSVGEGHHGLG